METLGNLLNIFSAIGVALLLIDKVRSRFFSAELDGKEIQVPSDEAKENFRKAALPVAKAKNGKDVDVIGWEGNVFKMKSK